VHQKVWGLLAQTLSFNIPTENNPKGIGLENAQAKGGLYDGR